MPRRKKILTAVVEPSPPAEASVLTGDIHYKPKAGDHVTFFSNGVEMKGTIVTVRLPNGFVLVESSACVDPANYDHAIGYESCMKRIRDKLWLLEGYRLQCELGAS